MIHVILGAAMRFAVLFAEDAVIGVGLVQHVDDRVFGVAIDVGDEIVALLFDDVQRVDPVHRANDDLTRAAAGAECHVDHCVHECGWAVFRRGRDSNSGADGAP